MFFKSKKSNQYLFNIDDKIDNLNEYEGNIFLPVVCDSEYTYPSITDRINGKMALNRMIDGKQKRIELEKSKGYRLSITSQWKGIFENEGIMYISRQFAEYSKQIGKKPRHKNASDFHLIDYLNDSGYKAEIVRRVRGNGTLVTRKNYDSENSYKTCQIVLYGHFLLVELGMIFENELKDDIDNLWSKFTMSKRIKAGEQFKDFIDMPWRIKIDGKMYWVQLCLVDTSALHGTVSYKDLLTATNLETIDKGKMNNYKSKMDIGYYENPEDFDSYSLGDLKVYDILKINAENFKQIYESLEISSYYQPPKLTIGASVADIFRSILLNELGIENNDRLSSHPKLLELAINQKYGQKIDTEWKPENIKAKKFVIDIFCKYGTAENLKNFTKSKAGLNSKVFGGRCRNNNPKLTAIEAILVDLDIDGCYGNGQRNQDYPIGVPVIEGYGYSVSSDGNQYPTLRNWLKSKNHGTKKDVLIPGLWQCFVSCKELKNGDNGIYEMLENAIDLIPSWHNFSFKELDKMLSDCQINSEDNYIDVKSGRVKIYSNQICNGILTHDGLQILLEQSNPQQKKELLDNLFVHASLYYPSYGKCNNFNELIDKLLINKETIFETTKKMKNNTTLQTIKKNEPSFWISFNMGELITNKLLAWRKMYPKKTPMNTLYKLIINTIYGDMVSPFFDISNVICGNNITARARALCYLMEKGLNGILSITDGNPININRVVYPIKNRKLTLSNLQMINDLTDRELATKCNIKLAPLNNADKIDLIWNEKDGEKIPSLIIHRNDNQEILTGKDAFNWVNQKTFEHLQNIFSDEIDVLNKESTDIIVENAGKSGEKPIISYSKKKGLFKFEMKDFYDSGVFHGSSNYLLINPKGYTLAFRAYESKKEHSFVESINDDSFSYEISIDEFKGKKVNDPATKFMLAILKNPNFLTRQLCFFKDGILKLNDYKNNERYRNKGYFPGDSIIKPGLLRELSLSQFTYKSIQQFKNIERQYTSSKNKFSQFCEMFFTNGNHLEYEKMIFKMYDAIKNGASDLIKFFDPSDHRFRDIEMNHPEHEKYCSIREKIYQIVESEIDEFDLEIETSDMFANLENTEGYTESELIFGIQGIIITDESLLDDW
jgi:hypothetical protein